MRHPRVHSSLRAVLVAMLTVAGAAYAVEAPSDDASEAPGKATPKAPTEVTPKAAQKVRPEAPAPGAIDLSTVDGLRTGLPYEKVVEQLGGEGTAIGRSTMEKATYRWSDQRGSSFICRFEDGKLVHKTGFRTGERPTTGDKPLLNQAQHEALKLGSPLQEALEIKPEGRRVSTGAAEVVEYRWTDQEGKTFEARFENGRLRQNVGRDTAARAKAKLAERKAKVKPTAPKDAAGEAVPKADEVSADAEGPAVEADPQPQPPDADGQVEPAPSDDQVAVMEEDSGEEPMAEEAMTEEPLAEEPLAEEPMAEEPMAEETAELLPGEEEPIEEAYEIDPAPDSGPRVHVAGASRREREEDQSSGRERRARLPQFRHSLRRGSYEILVRNPSPSQVTLGLRAEGEGRDATAGPNGATSFFVDQGVYSVYFIYRDDPYSLHQGPAIALDGFQLPDAEVILDGGNYTVRVLEGRSSRRR